MSRLYMSKTGNVSVKSLAADMRVMSRAYHVALAADVRLKATSRAYRVALAADVRLEATSHAYRVVLAADV